MMLSDGQFMTIFIYEIMGLVAMHLLLVAMHLFLVASGHVVEIMGLTVEIA